MDVRQISFDLLIKQRDNLISDIQELMKSFHTCFFSLIAFLTATISLSVTETIILTPQLAFVFFQAFFFVLLFLLGILTSMNNDRDYIRAIDKYISEEFGITTLFYQGEISYNHINRFNSKFSMITTLGALATLVSIIVLIIANYNFIAKIIIENLVFAVIIGIELISILAIIGKNMIYKINGKSKFYDDSFEYLKRAKLKKSVIRYYQRKLEKR